MKGRLFTPLPNIPYAIAPKNKHFDQVNMQKDTERPQVSKASGKWKDFGKREWDPVGGNWKITPSSRKSPDIVEGSDKVSETSGSIPSQSRRANNEAAHKRSYGQINIDRDAAVSRSPKRRNVGLEAETAALRQAREEAHQISQMSRLGLIREDSAHSGHNTKMSSASRPPSPDRAVSSKPAPTRDTTKGSGNVGGPRKIPFLEEYDGDDASPPGKTAGKVTSVNEPLFVSTSDLVGSDMQKGPDTPPRVRQSTGDNGAHRSSSLTQRSPIKVFRPTVKYSSPLGTRLDEPRSAPDLQKAAQALSQATSERQAPKAQSRTESLQKKQLGGFLHLGPKHQKPLDGGPSQQSRTSSTSAVDKAEDEESWKMAKAATAMQRVMQKPFVNNAAIAAQAKAGAQDAFVPKMTATGFTFEKPDPTKPMHAPSLSAAELDAITNTGPTSLRSLVDSTENIRDLIAAASKKSESKHRGRDESRSRLPSSGPPTSSKVGTILGEDTSGKLISEDDFILRNADQGWVALRIATQLEKRHGVIMTPVDVRKRYDELRGTHKGILLRPRDRNRSQARSASQPGGSERDDESFELDGNDMENEDDDNAHSVPSQMSLQPSRQPVGQSNLDPNKGETSSASGQQRKAMVKPTTKSASRPTTGGKTIASWKTEYHDALTTHDSDEEGEEEDPAPVTKPSDRIFNVYTVYHRTTATDDSNPEDTEPEILKQTYYDLGQANTVAQQAAFGEGFHVNGSLSWDFGANGLCKWSYIHDDNITTTWVEMEERLLAPSAPQPDESVNIIGRTVWGVKEEISEQDAFGEWQVVLATDVGAIHSSLLLANKAAADYLLEQHVLANPPKIKRLEVLDQWKAEQRRKAEETREWFDGRKDEFEEICELGEGRIVKVSVVARDFLGARN